MIKVHYAFQDTNVQRCCMLTAMSEDMVPDPHVVLSETDYNTLIAVKAPYRLWNNGSPRVATAQEQTIIDASANEQQQQAKPTNLKEVDQLYTDYLKGPVTNKLRAHGLIGPSQTVTPKNATWDNILKYMRQLRNASLADYQLIATDLLMFNMYMLARGGKPDSVWLD